MCKCDKFSDIGLKRTILILFLQSYISLEFENFAQNVFQKYIQNLGIQRHISDIKFFKKCVFTITTFF